MWIRLVKDTRSTSEYTKKRILREHILTVEGAEDNEYELLRIDISDKMYLDSLNLVYCGKDGEKSLGDGTKIEQNITKHFLFFAPASGKYKIETKVKEFTQYTYNVWALKGPLLPPVLEPQIYSPFDVIIGLNEHIDLFTAHVLHRVEGSEQWTAADFFQKNIHIGGLDATKTYEFKAQLIIPDLLETEESEIVKVSNMSSIVDKFRPDEFLLNSMLKFIVRDVPPHTCAITLQIKFPFEDWIRFAPSALQMVDSADLRDIYGNGEYIDESENEEGYMGDISYLIYRLEKLLYHKLDQDTVVEWQLIFKERTTQRVVHGPVLPFQLKKRPIGYEQMPKSMHFEKDRSRFYFHFGKNGEFQYEDVEQRKCNIKGRFTVEYASDNYMRLLIVPQTNFNQPIYKLNLSLGSSHKIFSVAEILDAILDYNITTQNDAVWIGDIIRLNLVNKEFYASIRRVLKIRAAIFDEDRLVIAHWIPAASRLNDVRVFTDYSDY